LALSDARFAIVSLSLNTAGGGTTTQTFYKTDKIRLRAYGDIKFNVDTDKIGNIK
jgi:hypothetical protein